MGQLKCIAKEKQFWIPPKVQKNLGEDAPDPRSVSEGRPPPPGWIGVNILPMTMVPPSCFGVN